MLALEPTTDKGRPGPRLVDGLEILAHLIHPEISPLEISWDSVQRIR